MFPSLLSPLSVFSPVALKRHINQQQPCAFQCFPSIKVISESFEALLCQERRVKRGEIDGLGSESKASEEGQSLHVSAAGRSNRPRQSEGCGDASRETDRDNLLLRTR